MDGFHIKVERLLDHLHEFLVRDSRIELDQANHAEDDHAEHLVDHLDFNLVELRVFARNARVQGVDGLSDRAYFKGVANAKLFYNANHGAFVAGGVVERTAKRLHAGAQGLAGLAEFPVSFHTMALSTRSSM